VGGDHRPHDAHERRTGRANAVVGGGGSTAAAASMRRLRRKIVRCVGRWEIHKWGQADRDGIVRLTAGIRGHLGRLYENGGLRLHSLQLKVH
jgi:hypothetical protein